MKLKTIINLLFFTTISIGANARDKTADSYFNGTNLYNDVINYVRFGIHRTATEGDNKTSEWIKNLLDKNGFKTEYLYFPVTQFFPDKTNLSVNGKQINIFPLWPINHANMYIAGGVVNYENGKNMQDGIVVVKIGVLNNQSIETIKAIIADGAKAVIVVCANAAGEIAAVNTEQNTSWDAPVFQVAPKDARDLINESTATITISGTLKNVNAKNVIGTIGNGPKSVIISTPISGWFSCGGERGPGIAIFNALAKWIGSQKHLDYKFIFIANSGHELADHQGTHVFLEKKAPKPTDTRLWVHLGASIATFTYQKQGDGVVKIPVVDPGRIVYYSNDEEKVIDAAFHDIGIKKLKGGALGELAVAAKAGYTPYFGFVGSSAFTLFHTPIDDASTTSPALLEEIGNAIKNAIAQELSIKNQSTLSKN